MLERVSLACVLLPLELPATDCRSFHTSRSSTPPPLASIPLSVCHPAASKPTTVNIHENRGKEPASPQRINKHEMPLIFLGTYDQFFPFFDPELNNSWGITSKHQMGRIWSQHLRFCIFEGHLDAIYCIAIPAIVDILIDYALAESLGSPATQVLNPQNTFCNEKDKYIWTLCKWILSNIKTSIIADCRPTTVLVNAGPFFWSEFNISDQS